MNQRAAYVLVTAIALGSAACSGTVTPGDASDGGTTGDTGIATDTGAMTDIVVDVQPDVAADVPADVPRDVPADVPADEPLIPDRGGIISASVTALPMPIGTNSVGAAAFWNFGMGSNPSSNCVQRTVGTCTIADCRGGSADAGTADAAATDGAPADATSGDGGGATGVSAGTITIAGGMTATPMTLMPDMNNAYQPANEMTARWTTGDRLTFTASGGEVPAFTTMLDFPTSVTGIDPPAPMGFGAVPVSRATGFMARWTAAMGDVVILIGQGLPTGGSRTPGLLIQCTFPGSAGMGTVPPAALSDLTPSTGLTTYGVIAIQGRASTIVTAGAYRVTVQAIGGDYAAFAMIM